MTGPEQNPTTQSVEQALADLQRLRELLTRAGSGQVDQSELREALSAYWRGNKPVLTMLAAAVGEQLRRQTLQALYEWRANLDSAQSHSKR